MKKLSAVYSSARLSACIFLTPPYFIKHHQSNSVQDIVTCIKRSKAQNFDIQTLCNVSDRAYGFTLQKISKCFVRFFCCTNSPTIQLHYPLLWPGTRSGIVSSKTQISKIAKNNSYQFQSIRHFYREWRNYNNISTPNNGVQGNL